MLIKKSRIIKFLEILLFLSCVKFLNLQSAICVFFFIVAYLYIFFENNGKLKYSRNLIVLVLFFITYCLFYCNNYGYNYSIIRTGIFSILMYSVGVHLIQLNRERNKFYQISIFIIACGMSLYAALSFFVNYTGNVLSSMNIADRYVADLWSDLLIHPTNFNSNNLIICAITMYSVFYVKGLIKIIPLGLVVTSIGVSFGTASRTNLLIIILSFVVGWIIKLLIQKQIIVQKKISRKIIVAMISIIVIWIGISYTYANRIIHLFNNLYSSLAYRTSNYVSVFEDPRIQSWVIGIKALFEYPFGGGSIKMESHNLMLDAGNDTGIIPFILLTMFMIRIIKMILIVYHFNRIDLDVKLLSLLTLIITFFALMIEPVFVARPYVFIYMCYIWGMTEALISNSNVNESNRIIAGESKV